MHHAVRQKIGIAYGTAICPICTNTTYRHRCRFCRGLGYVSRQRRNRYKATGRR